MGKTQLEPSGCSCDAALPAGPADASATARESWLGIHVKTNLHRDSVGPVGSPGLYRRRAGPHSDPHPGAASHSDARSPDGDFTAGADRDSGSSHGNPGAHSDRYSGSSHGDPGARADRHASAASDTGSDTNALDAG